MYHVHVPCVGKRRTKRRVVAGRLHPVAQRRDLGWQRPLAAEREGEASGQQRTPRRVGDLVAVRVQEPEAVAA